MRIVYRKLKGTYLAKQIIKFDNKLIAPSELSGANHASKALHMINLVACTHHQISLAKAHRAFGTFGAKQSVLTEITRKQIRGELERFMLAVVEWE